MYFRLAYRSGAKPIAHLCIVAMAAISLPATTEWKSLGPFGGPAAVLQTDPKSKTMLAGTSSALLFRSPDGGESWSPLPFPLRLRAVLHSLLIHPTIPDLYFAGVSADNTGTSGMWRSADGGSSWQPVSAFDGLPVRSIATFRGNPLRMAAGTDSGVFETTDGGLSWNRISSPDNRELQPVVSI